MSSNRGLEVDLAIWCLKVTLENKVMHSSVKCDVVLGVCEYKDVCIALQSLRRLIIQASRHSHVHVELELHTILGGQCYFHFSVVTFIWL